MKSTLQFLFTGLVIALLTTACGGAANSGAPAIAAAISAPIQFADVSAARVAPPSDGLTVQSLALATISATPSRTRTPLATATRTRTVPAAGPTSESSETYVAFDADFLADECPLFEGNDEVRQYGCAFGEYSMLHKQATTRYTYYNEAYDDSIVEATGYLDNGSGKYEYGIVFRANEDGTEYYVFTVTNDGRYNVSLYQDQKYTDLVPYTESPLVNVGENEANTFKVVARGNEFDFYLNDELIDTVTDDAIESGFAGLFFYNDTPDVVVGFDKFMISTFEEPPPTPTPTPTSNLPQTYVAYDADFFSEECPLFQGENETRAYGCDLGEYYMLHKEATTRYSYYDTVYDDAIVDATGYLIRGTGTFEYGLVFRANEDGTEYYVFTVTDDGQYNVSLYQDEKYTDLIPYTSSEVVRTGDDEWNTFRVVMRGDEFDFYLNGEFLDTVTDDAIDSGYTGFFFYNGTPDVEVGFDELTISTFEPPPPTPTAEPTSALATRTTTPAASPTIAVRPGLYISGLRFVPSTPKRGDPVTFYATFLNTTGREQHYKWLVEIWETDSTKKNPYGQADNLEQLIPSGTSERATGDSFKVAGGGPCVPFRAHVVYVDDQGRRVPFLRTNGTELWVPFQVCP